MIKVQPYLQAALLCEGVTTDENGRHNIYREFSQYTMGYSQPFTIFTIWRGSVKDVESSFIEQVEIIAPDGRVVASSNHNQAFSLPDNTYRQVNSTLLENVDFTHNGIYELQVRLLNATNTVVCTHTFPITVV